MRNAWLGELRSLRLQHAWAIRWSRRYGDNGDSETTALMLSLAADIRREIAAAKAALQMYVVKWRLYNADGTYTLAGELRYGTQLQAEEVLGELDPCLYWAWMVFAPAD